LATEETWGFGVIFLHQSFAAYGFLLIGARYEYPYSPDFSPIENCWSKIKSLLRSIDARNYPDLAKAIEEAFEQVTLTDIQGWFTHCC
jgi:hypothetical protein